MCRHTFVYYAKDTPASAATVAKYLRAWYTYMDTSPVKPVSATFGGDLGIGKELYANPTPNADFAGSILFKTKEDLTAFWKWLTPNADFKALAALNSEALRTQDLVKVA